MIDLHDIRYLRIGTPNLEHAIDLSTKILRQPDFERLVRSELPFWRSFRSDERVLWPPTR